jgi:hypothetical protein
MEAVSELALLAKAGTYSFHYEDVRFRDLATAPTGVPFGVSRLALRRGDYESGATLSPAQ